MPNFGLHVVIINGQASKLINMIENEREKLPVGSQFQAIVLILLLLRRRRRRRRRRRPRPRRLLLLLLSYSKLGRSCFPRGQAAMVKVIGQL